MKVHLRCPQPPPTLPSPILPPLEIQVYSGEAGHSARSPIPSELKARRREPKSVHPTALSVSRGRQSRSPCTLSMREAASKFRTTAVNFSAAALPRQLHPCHFPRLPPRKKIPEEAAHVEEEELHPYMELFDFYQSENSEISKRGLSLSFGSSPLLENRKNRVSSTQTNTQEAVVPWFK